MIKRLHFSFQLSVVWMQHVEQIENNPYCDAIQDYMKEKTGARSVPRVFVNGKFFGGGDDTVSCLIKRLSVIVFPPDMCKRHFHEYFSVLKASKAVDSTVPSKTQWYTSPGVYHYPTHP